MKKMIRNKKFVILSVITIILCIGVLIWACTSCTNNETYEGFSEDGMEVIDIQDEEDSQEDEASNKEESQMKEDETKAPSNWGDNETPSLDENGNQYQDSNEGSNDETSEDSKDDIPNTESGYGKPF